MRTPIPIYGCPSDPAAGNIHWTHNNRLVTCTNYLGVREINDGAIYLESCPAGPYQFVRGRSGEMCDTLHFWSYHPGGAHFLFGDGSVRFLSYTSDDIFPALATRSGGEVAADIE